MASGNDARLGLTKETTYGTRVAPSRFLPFISEGFDYSYNRYISPTLGTGIWSRPSQITTSAGSGPLTGDVGTTGMGILIDALHGNTVTPVQDGATTSWTQTHTLDTMPTKSYSIQVQTPPVLSNTLLPLDLVGSVCSGVTYSWSAAGSLRYAQTFVVRELQTANSLASYTPPTAWDPFIFKGGSVTIGGSLEGNILGDGSIALAYPLRDDAFALGSGGLMAKPVPTDKPTASGSFTADFNDLTNLNRTVNNTVADVVMKFEGATIASTFKFTFQVTIPDCVFTTSKPQVDGPGPVQQSIAFESASNTGDAPVIVYRTTDTAI